MYSKGQLKEQSKYLTATMSNDKFLDIYNKAKANPKAPRNKILGAKEKFVDAIIEDIYKNPTDWQYHVVESYGSWHPQSKIYRTTDEGNLSVNKGMFGAYIRFGYESEIKPVSSAQLWALRKAVNYIKNYSKVIKEEAELKKYEIYTDTIKRL